MPGSAEIKKWAGELRGKFAQKHESLILEISEEWLKILAVSHSPKGVSLDWIHGESVKGASEIDIAQKLLLLLKEKHSKPERVYISHSAHQLTTRILSIPSADSAEIRDILELQAVKQTPYTKEEITMGFRVIETEETGYSRVLLAISHRDLVMKYFRIADLLHLPVEKITLSHEGVQNWYQKARAKEAVAAAQNVLLLNIDWVSTDLLVFKGDKLVFTRSIGIGAKQIQQSASTAETELLREVQLSMESGNAEIKDGKISHVSLVGMGDSVRDLLALLSRELSLPCEVIQPFHELQSALLPPIVAIPEGYGSWISLIGIALDPSDTRVNLIPSEIEIRQGFESRAKDFGILGTLLLTFVMLVSVVSFVKVYKRNQYLLSLKTEYAALESQALEVERVVTKMRLAQDQMGNSNGVLDVLHDFSQVLPENISLSSVQYNDKEKTVTLRGISEEMSSVFQLLATLEATPSLEMVKTRNVTKSKQEDKDVVEFEIFANVSRQSFGSAKPPEPTSL